jgi:alkanesulfonate monooxygenase SsuD/methylene tetrahydromethanopterin reductase-like flavin-dependent oxidoreductase (luciferase family)
VKFHWFAQQAYTKLPPDFGTLHSSYVTAPTGAADPAQIGRDYHMYIRLMQGADKLGWDGVLVNEHHQTSGAMSPSPNLIASILAVTTENAAIALCGNSLALYNPPTRVAEELAMIDCLSEGRVIAGMVFGTPMDSAFAYGTSPAELRDRFYEARDLITRAWAAREPFSFNGKYTQLRYVNTWPRPVQDDVPIWIPGSGSLETWDLVNAFDYGYGYLSFSGKKNATPIVNGFWDHAAAHNANLNPNRMAFTQVICCADTDREAEAMYYDALKYSYQQSSIPKEFTAPPGYMTDASFREAINRSKNVDVELHRKAARGELSFWEYDELGYIIAGSPDRVEQRVRELATDLRVGQLITRMHVGNLSEEAAAENNYVFGTKVIPKLRDVWGDEEDRWTPKVSQERVAKLSSAAQPV